MIKKRGRGTRLTNVFSNIKQMGSRIVQDRRLSRSPWLVPHNFKVTVETHSPSQEIPHAARPYLNSTSAISPAPSGATRQDLMLLLICTNGKMYKTLAELRCLDVDDLYNDELLISGILSQYEHARKGYQWTIDLLLLGWMLLSCLV